MPKETPTQARLRELLNYDPDAGRFTWKIGRQGTGASIGKIAGGKGKNGYVYIGVDQRRMLAHRLAFLFMTGEIPELVDHIDGDKTNNRWANLRAATKSTNGQNMRRHHAGNISGFLGVSWSNANKSKPWVAQIKPPDGGTRNLGYYETPEEAHQAYLRAKREIHDGCTI